jgi:hypothetical protein
VDVLMRAQHQRCRDGEGEVEPWLVRTPAQRQCGQHKQKQEDHERRSRAAWQHLKDVLQRVHSRVGVGELTVGREGTTDRPLP